MTTSNPHSSQFERAVRTELSKKGIFFLGEADWIIGRPDIAFTSEKIAIFLDGCFWHACPEHWTTPKTNSAYWSSHRDRVRRRDRQVALELESEGWRVERFWEHQSPSWIAGRIARLK